MKPTGLRTAMGVTDEAWMFYSEELARDCCRVAGEDDAYIGDSLDRAVFWTEAIKQHYGPGTRYLDVTHSLGVAAWFALHKSESVKADAVYGADGPFDPTRDVVAEHTFVRYREEKESPGWIFVFDVPEYSQINKQEHGVMVDLAGAPKAFSSSLRIKVQHACLLYADKDVSEGDLSSFFVPGTPVQVGWPLDGAPEVQFSVEDIYPSPARDDWYARFVSIPLRPQFDRERRKAYFAHPIRVGLYYPDDESKLQETSGKFICIPPHLLFNDLLTNAPDDLEAAVSAWTPGRLADSTPIRLEGPLGIVLPSPDSNLWNQELLSGDMTEFAPVYDYLGGAEVARASLRNVFFELSPLENAGWERVESPSGGQVVFRGVWLVRDGEKFSVSLFVQELPNTRMGRIGPLRVRFELTGKIFEFETPAEPHRWLPVTEYRPLARMLFKTVSSLRDLSPGLKVDQCPSLTVGGDGEWTYLVKTKVALASLASLSGFGKPYSRYHLLLQKGDTKRFFGGANPNHPGFKGSLEVRSCGPFSQVDAQELKEIASQHSQGAS